MKIAFLASANGLGHTRRLISIALELEKLQLRCIFFLPCQLPKNSTIREAISEHGLETAGFCSNDYFDGPFTKFEKHNVCESRFNSENLDYFNFLICDTVLINTGNSNIKKILIAQFLWNLNSQNDFLLESYNQIFGFKYFSQKNVTQLKNFIQIPLFDYWNLSSYRKVPCSDHICIANSGAELVMNYLPFEINSRNYKVIYGLDEYLKNNVKPLAIICRPGLGAILECLSAGITPILINTSEFELNYNLQICVSNEWGIALKDFLKIPFENRITYLNEFNRKNKLPVLIQSEELVREYLLPTIGY
jgi:hypothetical protein